MAQQIALIIAHQGFQPVEYGVPKNILETAGIKVVTVSDVPGVALSKSGDEVAVNLTIPEINPEDYGGIFLIGGPGALSHLDTEATYDLMRRAAVSGKPWGAICIAPRILAHAGLLTDKRVTGWNDDGELESLLVESKALYDRASCVIDGKLITADGPGSAREFGEAILKQLS